jgi:proteasome lid subunit RPN8/RPN11
VIRVETVYITDGLLQYLREYARDAEPEEVTVSLAVTAAGDIPDLDLPPERPVFTHFYMPEAGQSVNAVFGMDLGTPHAQTQGRFVSHPGGSLDVFETDDLHAVVIVAVPPWGHEDVAAFDRRGRRKELRTVDAEPVVEDHGL